MTKKKCFWNLHYNGANSYLSVNGTGIHKFKAKDSEIVATPLCLGNISKDWSLDNLKKLDLMVYDFGVDYDTIAADDILGIYKYLMEKNNIIWYVWKRLDSLKNIFNRIFIIFKSVNCNSVELYYNE